MASTQTRLRRGTSAQVESMTPVEAEVVVDLSNDRLKLGDGVTVGGIAIPNAFDMQTNSFGFVVAGGTANAITATLAPAPSSYTQPMTIKVRISTTNTGAVTINLNGLGARNVYKMSAGILSPLISADLVAGTIYEFIYDGVQFQILGGVGGIVSVGQGDLKTGIGSVSVTNASSLLVLPGGQYGFYPQISLSGSGGAASSFGVTIYPTSSGSITNFSATSYIHINALQTGFPATGTATQRYVTSSPPYNMGDGEVGGFIFALVNNAGDVVASYAADTPPWAYNGPTDICATHKCKITGKKFNNKLKQRNLDEIMSGAPVSYEMQEITNELKNRDMALIPHPFGQVPTGHRVILLDPMSDKVSRMIEYQNAGGNELSEALTKGYIKIDNDTIKRSCPKSVIPCKFKWKGMSNG